MTTQRDTTAFNSIWRFGITPLFLFSGTFFPIEQLPDAVRRIAWLLPAVARRRPRARAVLGTVGDDAAACSSPTSLILAALRDRRASSRCSVMFRRQLEP